LTINTIPEMKYYLIITILMGFLYMSCRQTSQEDSFRARIDKIKNKDVPKMEYSVSTFAVDSSKYWNIVSQIIQQQKAGLRSTTIKTEFNQKGKSIKEVSNNLNRKVQFQGQIITTDLSDKILIYYCLQDEQQANSIFKVTCKANGESSLEKTDSIKLKEWSKIKSSILNKN
jgi:hypothetical protein